MFYAIFQKKRGLPGLAGNVTGKAGQFGMEARKRKLMKWEKWAALFLAAEIGLAQTGCGNDSEVQEETTHGLQEHLEESAETSMMYERNVPVGSLELAPVKHVVNEQGDVVFIGSLEIIIPTGWKLETQAIGEEIEQYILKDAHSECEDEGVEAHRDGYEHEIVITPYQIKQMPESGRQLASEMRRYFSTPRLYKMKGNENASEIDGFWMYGENDETCEVEYFLFSKDAAGGIELFHVQDGDTLISSYENDVEQFREFMDENLVRTDGGKNLVKRTVAHQMEACFLLNENTKDSLFMTVDSETMELSVYRADDCRTALYTKNMEGYFWLDSVESMGIADLNGDGYEDLLCNDKVLNPKRAQESQSEEENFDGFLWDEEKMAFVYVEGGEMLDKCASFWEEQWEEPEEEEESVSVPEELIAYVSEYLLKSEEELREAMLSLVADRELTLEEVEILAKENPDIKKELMAIVSNSFGQGIWLKVDADNDGIDDVFLCQYLGGSLGAVTYYLFKGDGNGKYEMSGWHENLREEFAFIRWEGKNYLAKTTWDFTKKCVDGISIECYGNGRHRGGVWLYIAAEDREDARSIETSYIADKKFEKIAEGMEKFAKTYEIGSRVEPGTAEEENSDYDRRCDIDNDGVEEEYRVSRWQTTNYYTVDSLEFRAEEELRERIFDMVNEDEIAGIPLNLWVDKTEHGNVVYVLYEEGLYDFHICAYLLSENDRKLAQTDCYTRTKISVRQMESADGIMVYG